MEFSLYYPTLFLGSGKREIFFQKVKFKIAFPYYWGRVGVIFEK
jgi:hypothetical protein